jgi:hypothetical protein
MDSQNPTPQQPITAKAKLSKWIIAVIAVLILFLVIAGGVIVKTQNIPAAQAPSITPIPITNPTATWKTYSNTKYNYLIDYPSDWSLREFPDTKDGAGFNPLDKPGYPDRSESITISAGQKIGNYVNDTFEDYVKIAASQEIQNYNKLASIKKVTTAAGIIGYETTWMVQSTESLPISYFELPGNKNLLVRFYLNKPEDLAIYEKMLSTLKFIIPSPTPVVDEKSVLETVIKKYIASKHNSDENSLTITVSQINENYAKGGATQEGGGGMWFAAKKDGVWKLVWDGNGVILCSDLSLYPDFPANMIPECWDDATQNSVQR